MIFPETKMSRRKQAKPNRVPEDEDEVDHVANNNVVDVDKDENVDFSDQDNDSNHSSKIGEDRGQEEEDYEAEDGTSEDGIKERLLKMNLGISSLLSPDLSEQPDPSKQLKSIGENIVHLSSNLVKVAKPSNLQELSILQATLLSLQQNQLIQFHLLNQVHKSSGDSESLQDVATRLGIQNPFVNQLVSGESKSADEDLPRFDVKRERELFPLPSSANTSLLPKFNIREPTESRPNRSAEPEPTHDSLGSSIITNHEPVAEGPVNTLELLQQKAQGILNNASKGVLSNSMTDIGRGPAVSHSGAGGREESGGIKHRCKYCGKVFGSDSALQIHIRSHTGERPYKCNVCGNRFTTKGNLKVHFQRHADRFPMVKMNPNMVPEHLDKFYPSLLQQCEEAEKKGLPMPNINNPMAGMNAVVPPGMSLPANLPGMPPPVTSFPQQQIRLPSFPSAPKMPLTAGALPRYPLPTEPIKKEELFSEKPAWLRNLPIFPRLQEQKERFDQSLREERDVFLPRHTPGSSPPTEEKRDNSPEEEDDSNQRDYSLISESGESSVQDEPENLSSDRREDKSPLRDVTEDRFRLGGGIVPVGLPQFPVLSSLQPPGSLRRRLEDTDPASQDPAVLANILPYPGSTDNSWETLIEVDKSNEASKLEHLVDKSEGRVTEPNECLICHRILSCKSALQMHYRTHTGERPFKCKICKRTFTTKGNLKTHMSVHRTKPPMRAFPQCPVCHKKYGNPAVLQQHIKTHTGEKTEMSLEQISAAEIKDFPAGLAADALNKFLPFPAMTSPLSVSNFDEDEKQLSRPSSVSSSTSVGSNFNSLSPYPSYNSFSASLAALEKQVKTMDPRDHEDGRLSQGKLFPADLLPEVKYEEPEDLSKSASDEKRASDCDSSCDRGQSSDPEEEDRQEGSPHPPPAFSRPPMMLPVVPGIPAFPNLHNAMPGGQLFPPLGFPNPLTQLATSGGLHPVPGFQPLGLPFPAIRYALTDDLFAARGRTTCQLCFKVFACNSALEIHMRSHTKERPFKCDVCGKGFTTKGNMKQHQMTHKFRDSDNFTPSTPPQPPAAKSPVSSPLTSPPTSEPVSPQFPTSGVKRPQEDVGVPLVDRPPEKRAILCG